VHAWTASLSKLTRSVYDGVVLGISYNVRILKLVQARPYVNVPLLPPSLLGTIRKNRSDRPKHRSFFFRQKMYRVINDSIIPERNYLRQKRKKLRSLIAIMRT